MNISSVRALVTGAPGGIGEKIVTALLERGARVLITDRDTAALSALADRLSRYGERVTVEAADLCEAPDRQRLCAAAAALPGGINVLINNAGLGHFGLFEESDDRQIERLLAVNVAAPLELTRALLPLLRRQPHAAIVNMGSVFGIIGYPGQAVYVATKFAMRGFSEALRRELADSNVRVLHVAPRATRTRLNSAAVDRLNEALRVAMDPPEKVAAAVCKALERERASSVLGWPEKLYARINSIAPGIVDRSLAKTLPIVKKHAAANPALAAARERAAGSPHDQSTEVTT